MIDLGKQNLLGVGIDAVDYEAAVARVIEAAVLGRPYGVSALAVHGVMTGVLDEQHRYRLNQLDLVVPDGQPVRWGLNWLHRTRLAERVYGPNLMLHVCEAAAMQGLRVCLFGGTSAVLNQLRTGLESRHRNLQIVATIPSKFRQLTGSEKEDLIEMIRASGAQIVFVGLGCPRQEVWTYEFKDRIGAAVLAVGAAFDFHAGRVPQAPSWMQRIGLEWLFRLLREPLRLWKRYILLNPYFLWLLVCQKLGWKKFSLVQAVKPDREILYG